MIVYLFNNENYVTINLPIKISGMYPLYIKGKLIANIYSQDEKWLVQLSNGSSNELIANGNILVPYSIYNLVVGKRKEKYYLVSTPKYDSRSYQADILKPLSIGSDVNCDVYYSYDENACNGEFLKVTPYGEGSSWLIETYSNNFFVSGERAISGMKIKSGDFIFYFGLKIIFVGNRIIVNNPNNRIKIKNGSVLGRGPEPDYSVNSNSVIIENDEPLYSKDEYFFKSPRFNFVIEEANVKIDEPPEPIQEDETPFILSIGPQLTMVTTSVLSMVNMVVSSMNGNVSPIRFYISIATMIVTIISAMLWPSVARFISKKNIKMKEKKRQILYKKYLKEKEEHIRLIKENQKSTIINNFPSAEACLKIINNKSKELWQRSIDHDDFLSLRLGIGNFATKIDINVPEDKFSIEEEDNLFAELKKIINNSLTIENVPINYTFTDQSINAIVGEQKLIKEFMDCVFLQMLTFHAYTDLKLIIFTKEPSKWEYLKVAPHCWDNQKSIRYFATNVEELSVIATGLEKIFDSRVADSDDVRLEDDGGEASAKKNFKDYRPYYLFFVDDMTSVRNVSLINKILHYKRNMGFSMIITSDSISNLPSETSDFICISENESAIMTSKISGNQRKFKADFNKIGAIDIYTYVQKLANIPIAIDKEKYELPESLSFLELYNLGRVEQLNSLARWSDNNPVLSLSVPVGVDQSGEIFKMDIHEKAYGPHGLVAGTTGSGKSEWIITYILSLAVNYSPDEVQFVLIDYKGGGLAMSFENSELGIKLPHLAGTITNLDKSEIFRSIAAIESELKRRQSIFNDAREKLKEGSMNIYKYQQYYRKGMVEEPLSHLLIICDEFAEMKQQQPEFMDQLISTSRIGRSLGIHLILATQKPSGVVNDQIWSNSKFKVCLKVQDKSDSNEMLKKPDAAFLKQTGAFYLQVGNDDYYNLGQSAWAGAKYYPSDTKLHKVDESIEYIDNIGRTIGFYEEKKEEIRESKGEELINIVSYVSDISKQIGLKAKPLWLNNVPTKIVLSELFKKYRKTRAEAYTYKVAIGEYDEPRKQTQGLLEIDLQGGNIAIMGQNGSGIDGVVSTIMWSSLIEHSPSEIAYYVIDFGAETLKKFSKFPQVGEVVLQDDVEKIGGVLDLVIDEIDKRKNLLSDYNGSFEYYNKVNKKKLPLIVTVMNSYDIFIESFPRLDDTLTNLFRDAVKYGIIFIVSVNSPNGLRQRQLQFFNRILLMQFNDDSQYRNITNCRKRLIPKKAVGRGICKIDDSSDSYCEFQTAMIAPEDKELDLIKGYANKCIEFYKHKVKQLEKIPDDVTSDDLVKYITTLSNVPLGYNFYEKNIAKLNLLNSKTYVITSKSIKDQIQFIYAFSAILAKISGVKVRIIDMLEIFKKPVLDTKLFNENLDIVIATLENDAFHRTETQDYGINLIIGAGQYKKKLSAGGAEIFKNIFVNLEKSKKSIYIFIDDYEKIRTLKLESWFDKVNLENGLWLGSGFANQSFITSNELSSEDKKINYDGIAFNVTNGEYTIMKIARDGDK